MYKRQGQTKVKVVPPPVPEKKYTARYKYGLDGSHEAGVGKKIFKAGGIDVYGEGVIESGPNGVGIGAGIIITF